MRSIAILSVALAVTALAGNVAASCFFEGNNGWSYDLTDLEEVGDVTWTQVIHNSRTGDNENRTFVMALCAEQKTFDSCNADPSKFDKPASVCMYTNGDTSTRTSLGGTKYSYDDEHQDGGNDEGTGFNAVSGPGDVERNCGHSLNRWSTIEFRCNAAVGIGMPTYVDDDNDCEYVFLWESSFGCGSNDTSDGGRSTGPVITGPIPVAPDAANGVPPSGPLSPVVAVLVIAGVITAAIVIVSVIHTVRRRRRATSNPPWAISFDVNDTVNGIESEPFLMGEDRDDPNNEF